MPRNNSPVLVLQCHPHNQQQLLKNIRPTARHRENPPSSLNDIPQQDDVDNSIVNVSFPPATSESSCQLPLPPPPPPSGTSVDAVTSAQSTVSSAGGSVRPSDVSNVTNNDASRHINFRSGNPAMCIEDETRGSTVSRLRYQCQAEHDAQNGSINERGSDIGTTRQTPRIQVQDDNGNEVGPINVGHATGLRLNGSVSTGSLKDAVVCGHRKVCASSQHDGQPPHRALSMDQSSNMQFGVQQQQQQQQPPRERRLNCSQHHVVPSDMILRIRSADADPSTSFRNIRSVLLQIRDSLSPAHRSTVNGSSCDDRPTGSASAAQLAAVQRAADANVASSDDSDEDEVDSKPRLDAASRSIVANDLESSRRQYASLSADYQRSDRFSLPTPFYRHEKHVDCSEQKEDLSDDEETRHKAAAAAARAASELSARRRRRSNVKFADQFGLNMNTFVMIPSRAGAAAGRSGAVCHRAVEPTSAVDSSGKLVSGDGNGKSMGGKDLQSSFNLQTAASSCNGKENGAPSPSMLDYFKRVINSEVWGDPNAAASSQTSLEKPTARSDSEFGMKSSSVSQTESFRLCFDQPFANLEKFNAKLRSQMVCLENVLVESCHNSQSPPDSPRSSSPSPTASNSAILCSIRVRNLHPEKRVFARCTDNNWQTFADLPAQHVGGFDSLGYEEDRFCFAVCRPECAMTSTAATSGTASLSSTAASSSSLSLPRSVAVEFAICYQVAGRTYWDNNDRLNYRIEWYL